MTDHPHHSSLRICSIFLRMKKKTPKQSLQHLAGLSNSPKSTEHSPPIPSRHPAPRSLHQSRNLAGEPPAANTAMHTQYPPSRSPNTPARGDSNSAEPPRTHTFVMLTLCTANAQLPRHGLVTPHMQIVRRSFCSKCEDLYTLKVFPHLPTEITSATTITKKQPNRAAVPAAISRNGCAATQTQTPLGQTDDCSPRQPGFSCPR